MYMCLDIDIYFVEIFLGEEWLQGCLKDCSKTAMVISHDFNFLQEASAGSWG